MPFSRYLYCKVKEAREDEISLILNSSEIEFLKSADVPMKKKENGTVNNYLVSSNLLKHLFCN